MSVLIIDEAIKAQVNELIAKALENPVQWDKIKHLAVKAGEPLPPQAQRPDDVPEPQKIIIGSYRCAYSVEEQPHGMCRHLSVSTPKPGMVPNPIAMKLIVELFGFTRTEPAHEWLEEFDHNHHAHNIAQLMRKS